MTAHVVVERLGRWTYRIVIVDGTMEYGPEGYGWVTYGRGRAQRKARRQLAKYRRKAAWHAQKWRLD